MKARQSAVSWFHLASRTSALASSSSDADNDGLRERIRSEVAIARIVMSVFAEARHAARDPFRGPVDELDQRHARIAEQPHRLGGIDQPGFARLRPSEHRRLAEPLTEGLREPADAH